MLGKQIFGALLFTCLFTLFCVAMQKHAQTQMQAQIADKTQLFNSCVATEVKWAIATNPDTPAINKYTALCASFMTEK